MLRHLNSRVHLTKPGAVLFDIDNTLYDYEFANYAASQAVERTAIGLLHISRDTYRTALKQARQDIKARLGNTSSSHSRLLYFQRMVEILGFRPRLSFILELEQMFWDTFFTNAPLFPGVVGFLQCLRHQEIPTAIITDLTAQVQLRKLVYFKIENAFDVVVTSEEVGTDKPEFRNFKLALDKLQVETNNSQIWMVGDNPKTDILGGQTIGAVTFQKVHGSLKVGVGREAPDYAFSTFTELAQCVSKCWHQNVAGLQQNNKVHQKLTTDLPIAVPS